MILAEVTGVACRISIFLKKKFSLSTPGYLKKISANFLQPFGQL